MTNEYKARIGDVWSIHLDGEPWSKSALIVGRVSDPASYGIVHLGLGDDRTCGHLCGKRSDFIGKADIERELQDNKATYLFSFNDLKEELRK